MVQDISASIEACAAHYGEDADAVRDYLTQGQARALALPNRGTLKFDADGTVHSDILEAYAEYGFYVFEKALSAEELADLQSDMAEMRTRFPIHMGAETDSKGRPAIGVNTRRRHPLG